VKVDIHDDDDDDEGPQPLPLFDKPVHESGTGAHNPQERLAKDAYKTASASPATSSTQPTRQIGPSFPTYAPTYNPDTYDDDDDDDDDYGPKPLPAGMSHEEPDAVKRFIEREQKQRQLAEEASKPKAAKRDEWMLVPPTSSGLLGSLDPTKLSKPRQFSRGIGPAAPSAKDMSLWTESPQERQQRLADEVSGKKRRVTEATVDPEMEAANKRRRQQEDTIRHQVEEYNRKRRGPALIDKHDSADKEDGKDTAIWDHARDMGLGGRLMDDGKRKRVIDEAKSLNDRFQPSTFS